MINLMLGLSEMFIAVAAATFVILYAIKNFARRD